VFPLAAMLEIPAAKCVARAPGRVTRQRAFLLMGDA